MFHKIVSSHVSFINKLVKLNTGLFGNPNFFNFMQRNCMSSKVNAGIIVIGDEILKGTTDINTPFLIKELNSMNVNVSKVAIVPDDVDTISQELYELSAKCSFVVTSGGIGPTHDDVTYEAVAKAFHDELHLNQELFKLIVKYFGPESKSNPGVLKYASIPRSSIIIYLDIAHNGKLIKYPLVSVRNIYIFPGVPVLLQKSFNNFKCRFKVENEVSLTKEVFIDLDEFLVTAVLNKAVEKFHEHVKFGSYPTFTENYYKVKLVLESPDHNYIEDACTFLKENLPRNSIVDVKKTNVNSCER